MRALPVALALALALALAGCGFGAGSSSSGGARLEITRDFGAKHGQPATLAHVSESDTVMRFLQATHEVKTRYGGGFVDSVDGMAGDKSRQYDWFFYVNGIESDVGAADFGLSEGDRIQWDLHSWRETMRIPGIVGAFPEPFRHGYRGKRLPVRVECAAPDGPACREATKRLTDAGVAASNADLGVSGEESAARVVVGPWDVVRRLQAATALRNGPAESGVFARFAGSSLELLNAAGGVARSAPAGTGLVAARVLRNRNVVWFVTGVDDAGVGRAARALDEDTLHDAFALAATPSGPLKLPLGAEQ
jgi:hypothetical protein